MSMGMNQVDVSVRFTANTEEAKRKIQELQSSLSSLTKNSFNSGSFLGLDKEMNKAVQSAMQLKGILSQSLTNAGTLDMGKFSQNILRSGVSIKQYARDLQSLGPQGTQAFSQLSQSIAMAEVPLRRTSALMNSLGNTLKNTAKWQLSSSLLHGFISAVQGAYSYAQDLNESLNNIRIVSGQNADQMAEFAKEANKAAKALSTTTTEYTNASLIYYQQGLSESEVKERTDITIKMANAAGQSAEVVSDQMTAVWNNFDDGSKSLEYYADVMTALGAATASSTDEIAEGLEKFSAVADTVGLSYEYATAALATVTAETRQSAEVVGTAFKTLFARIEGLKLGETLEDGTTLNKYSEALLKVGINIKDANGELKDMDIILSEMGERWNTLSKDQQVALAQAVGGIRQYNQLISLMDNWDVFKENLEIVADAEGTLTEQAGIYADSWEASKDRVTASAEAIYSALLRDDFFIGLNNTISKILDSLSGLLQALGGAPGLLALISTFMFKAFGPQIATSIERSFYNMRIGSEWGREAIVQLKRETNEAMIAMLELTNTTQGMTQANLLGAQGQVQEQLLQKTLALESIGKSLTAQEQERVNMIFETLNGIEKEVEAEFRLLEAKKQNLVNLQEELNLQLQIYSARNTGAVDANTYSDVMVAGEQLAVYRELLPIITEIDIKTKNLGPEDSTAFNDFTQQLLNLDKVVKNTSVDLNALTSRHNPQVQAVGQSWQKLISTIKTGDASIEAITQEMKKFKSSVTALGSSSKVFDDLRFKLSNMDDAPKELISVLGLLKSGLLETGATSADAISKLMGFGGAVNAAGEQINGFVGKTYGVGDSIQTLGYQFSALGMVLSSLQGLSDIWDNEDLSTGEKLISTITSLSMVVPMLTSAFSKNNRERLRGISTTLSEIALEKAQLVVKKKELGIEQSANLVSKAGNVVLMAKNGQLTTQIALEMILQAIKWQELLIKLLLVAVIGTLIALGAVLIGQLKAEAEAAQASAESNKERLEEMQSAAEETKNLSDSIKELTDSYSDQLRAGNSVTDLYEQINEVTQDLIKAYEDLNVDEVTLDLIDQGKALGLATGNWDQYYKAVTLAGEIAEENLNKQHFNTVDSNVRAAKYALSKGGYSWKNGGTTVSTYSDDANKQGDSQLDSWYNENIVQNDNNEDIERILSHTGFGTTTGQFLIKIRTDTASNFLTDYQALEDLKLELEESELNNTDLYKRVTEQLEKGSEYAMAIENSLYEAAEYLVDVRIDYDNINVSGINTFEEYVDTFSHLYQNMSGLTSLVGEDNASSFLHRILGSKGDFSEFEAGMRFIDKALNKWYDDEQPYVGDRYLLSYLNELSEEDRKIIYSLDISYTENLQDLKTLFAAKKEFMIKVGIKYNAEEVLETATGIRNDLQDAMEDFSEQGYLTTTQAIEFINEYPQYKNYLISTAEGYKFTAEAVNKYNEALANQKKALDEILDPASVGRQALVDFAEELIQFEVTLNGFEFTAIRHLTEDFINGKIASDEYFNDLQNKINNMLQLSADGTGLVDNDDGWDIDLDDATKKELFTNHLMDSLPTIIAGVVKFGNALDEAFEAGQISSEEYRKSIKQTAETVSAAMKRSLAIAQDMKDAGYASNVEEIETAISALNTEISELDKQIAILNAYEAINLAITDDFEDLDAIFDQNFKIEIDSSSLDEAIRKTQDFREAVHNAFNSLADDDMKDTIIQKIADVGAAIGYTAASGEQAVITAAQEMLKGTFDASKYSTDMTAKAMGLILASGADTIADVGTYVDSTIEKLKTLISGFSAEIGFTPKGFELVETSFSIAGYVVPIKLPKFLFEISGKLSGDTQSTMNSILDDISMINSIENGSTIGLELFRPESGEANPEDVELDDEDDGKDEDKDEPSEIKSNKQIERYKELNDAIEDVTRSMDKAADEADRLYGSAKIDALEEEIANSEILVELLEQQIEDANIMLELDRQRLDIAAKAAGIDFVYDKTTGNIINFTQQMAPLYEQLLDYERQLNAMTSKEEQDAFKKAHYDPLLEQINNLEAAVKQYDETRDLIDETQEKIRKEKQKQEDRKLQIFKYKIEVKLDINDREMKLLDLLLKRIDDDAFAAAQSIDLLSQKANEAMDDFDAYKEGIEGIYAKHGLTPEIAATMSPEQLKAVGFTEEELDTIKEYNDGMIESVETLMDLKQQVEDSLIELFDAWNEKIGETIDKFTLLNDTLSAFQNIADVLGHSRLGLSLDWQKKMIETQNQIGLDQLESLVKKNKALKETAETSNQHLRDAEKRLETARKLGKDDNVIAELEADVEYWKDMVEKTTNELEQSEVDIYTNLDEFVTQAAENYKRLTEAILEEWERSVSAMGKTLEETMDMYDKAEELEERYVTNYEKAYSLSKLTADLEKSLNDTTSLKHQEQLKNMMKEIQEIQESGKVLSQYDLDYLQKKYELTVAQMALEDAHNAKTQVIRRRDSEGNWGYVYTANEEDKEAAMATYRDKVYEMMELNENFIEDTEAKLLEARQRMAEELAALADMALSEEEYNERSTAIIEHYQELDSYYLGEIQKVLDNNNTLYDNDALAFAEKAGFKLSTAIAFRNDYVTITEDMARTILSIEESTFQTREEYLQALADATGLSVNTVTKMYEGGVIKALELSEDQRDGIAKIDEENFKNKEDYLKEVAKVTGLSIDEVTEMYEAGTLAAIRETEKLEGNVLGSNTAMTLSFGQTTLSAVTGYGSTAAAGAAFGAANTVLTAGLSANYAAFAAVAETALGIVGISTTTFGTISSGVMDTANAKSEALKNQVGALGSQMVTSFGDAAGAVTAFQTTYSEKIGECTTATEAFTGAIIALLTALNNLNNETNKPKSPSILSGGSIGSLSDLGNAFKNGSLKASEIAEYLAGSIWMDVNSSWGNGQERKDKFKQIFGDNWQEVYDATQSVINTESYNGTTWNKWKDDWGSGLPTLSNYSFTSLLNDIAKLDTGGYTGKWGPDGKLAMLHEKELVLNKQDTSNFLLALDVLERIISNVSANSLTFNPVQPINVSNLSGLQGLEQNITIHADFPDATSAKDIEEAFNLMINRASQYVNMK